MLEQMIKEFRAAIRVGVPIVAVTTSDPGAVLDALAGSCGDDRAVLGFDIIHGLRAYNGTSRSESQRGLDVAARAKVGIKAPADQNPIAVLAQIEVDLQPRSVVFVMNGHRIISDKGTPAIQAIWNLRDPFKTTRRTLVLLGTSFSLSAELEGDVVVLDDPLPTPEQVSHIISRQYENAGVAAPPEDVLARATSAVSGLPSFTVEQIVAMSMTRAGVALDALWHRKQQAIENTPGLSVWEGGGDFDSLGGLANIKAYMRLLRAGRNKFGGVVWIDEIEKAAAGMKHDTSGVSQDQHQALLTWMEDHDAAGVLLIGHPGSGKSAIAKATGAEMGTPTIRLDLGGLKNGIVGSSEGRIRAALKTIESVCLGRPLFIATCNEIESLSPELRSRFKTGTFFFDLPTAEERARIWSIYRASFNIPATDETPDDENWTGREIRACCQTAADTGLSLVAASSYIVPMATASRQKVEALRELAEGKFISASTSGPYSRAAAQRTSIERAIDVN